MNPLLNPKIETRAHVVRMSLYAANNGGMDVCINDCEREKEAHCSAWADWKQPAPSKDPKFQGARCCAGCHTNYLTEEQQELVKKELNIVGDTTGYWKAEVGCRLPRSHRPTMCLQFFCRTMERKAPQAIAILEFTRRANISAYNWPA